MEFSSVRAQREPWSVAPLAQNTSKSSNSSSNNPETEYCDSGSNVTLSKIVEFWLRDQHQQCRNPMSTVPEFSLFTQHQCPEPRNKSAPVNATMRFRMGFEHRNHGLSKWAIYFFPFKWAILAVGTKNHVLNPWYRARSHNGRWGGPKGKELDKKLIWSRYKSTNVNIRTQPAAYATTQRLNTKENLLVLINVFVFGSPADFANCFSSSCGSYRFHL